MNPDITYSRDDFPALRFLLTPDEAAATLGIKRSMLYRLLRRGEILSVQVGSARRIPVKALEAYVERLCAAQKAS
jgi:excisionase family DNA binding protein